MKAHTKEYHFAPQDLYNLLVHYTDGMVPLNGEVKFIMTHPSLSRKIGIVVDSDEWETIDPLFLHYDGKRVRTWYKGEEGSKYEQLNDTPNRQ